MRKPALAIAATVSILAVSGCASSAATTAHPLVLPISPKGMRGLDPPQAARFLSPTRLALAGIAGSSNCPSVPKTLTVEGPHRIRIDLVVGSWGPTASGRRVEVPHRPGICLADLHPVPVVVAVDSARIDVHHRLKVTLHYPRFAVRPGQRLVVVTVPPLPTAQVREEVRVARASNRLFSIFPSVPGTRRCLIPGTAAHGFEGICRTGIHARPTMEPSWTVTFTESWWPHCPPMTACSPRALRHHTWEVGEGETIVRKGTKPHVFGIRSRGDTAPQSYE
jgi:hypothetical protein